MAQAPRPQTFYPFTGINFIQAAMAASLRVVFNFRAACHPVVDTRPLYKFGPCSRFSLNLLEKINWEIGGVR